MSINYKDFIEEYPQDENVSLHPINELHSTNAKINVMIDEDNSLSSKDDTTRREVMWDSKNENVIKKWIEEMREQANKHYKAGKKQKRLHEWITVPSILIPVIASGLTPILQPYPYISTGLMLTVGILTGINGFYNFASKKEKHLSYEGLYSTLIIDIEKELSKHKRDRLAVDVYLENISMKKINLDLSAPLI